VAAFKLDRERQSHGAAPVAPAAPLAARPAGGERRGANRAKNVTRPAFGAKQTLTPRTRPVAAAAASAKTGTDDEWTSF